jgi:adenylate kinase family enzyme
VQVMPLLGAADPLPNRPRRVLVAGTSGSGKTTLATQVAAVLQVPYVELDALFHGPGWVPRPEFEADVHRFSAGPGWVTEWMYAPVRAHLAGRADLLVWLDLPRSRVMRQVVRRTVWRRVRRQRLWNGNVEPPLRTFVTDRDHIVRWAWRTHERTAERIAAAGRRRPELLVVRLTGPNAVAAWIRGPLRARGTGLPSG